MISGLQDFQLTNVVTAIGGLGTAAFGLVDAAKAALPGINRIGFAHIKQVVAGLTPEAAGRPLNALPQANILETLEANWANGTDLPSQKAIAKSLIKMHLNAASAPDVAAKANVDAEALGAVADKMSSGVALTQGESDASSRFDLIVTALLDEAYQISEQVYRNATRMLAAIVAVLLAEAGTWSIGADHFWQSREPVMALLVGLLATPLAPIAKDLSSALAAAVNAMQSVKK